VKLNRPKKRFNKDELLEFMKSKLQIKKTGEPSREIIQLCQQKLIDYRLLSDRHFAQLESAVGDATNAVQKAKVRA